MIKPIEEKPNSKIEIDLTGPQGNAFYLLGIARKLAEQLDKDAEDICERMKEGNYEHLIEIFEKEFGNYVILWM